MTASQTPANVPVRSNYKGHGRPTRLYYFGRTVEFNLAESAPLVDVSVERSMFVLTSVANGEVIDRFGAATKFWACLIAPSVEFWELYRAAGNVIPSAEAVRAAEEEKRDEADKTPTTKLHACRCQCGNSTKRIYMQGHDAKHVAILRGEVNGNRITLEGALKILSPALGAKLVAQLANDTK